MHETVSYWTGFKFCTEAKQTHDFLETVKKVKTTFNCFLRVAAWGSTHAASHCPAGSASPLRAALVWPEHLCSWTLPQGHGSAIKPNSPHHLYTFFCLVFSPFSRLILCCNLRRSWRCLCGRLEPRQPAAWRWVAPSCNTNSRALIESISGGHSGCWCRR